MGAYSQISVTDGLKLQWFDLRFLDFTTISYMCSVETVLLILNFDLFRASNMWYNTLL